jgi:hypothetical protein
MIGTNSGQGIAMACVGCPPVLPNPLLVIVVQIIRIFLITLLCFQIRYYSRPNSSIPGGPKVAYMFSKELCGLLISSSLFISPREPGAIDPDPGPTGNTILYTSSI